MNNATRAKSGLEEIKCKYCDTVFMPIRSRQFLCGSNDCKNANAREYRNRTIDKGEFRNVMAKWRTKNPAKKILSNIKSRNNIDIDEQWIQDRLNKGICEVTGIKFEFMEYGKGKAGFNHHPWTPSVDKIDPNGGYRQSNCQLVVWAYNRAKGLWSEDIMLKLGKGIINGME